MDGPGSGDDKSKTVLDIPRKLLKQTPRARSNTATPTQILEEYTGELYAVKFVQVFTRDAKSAIDPELLESMYQKYPCAIEKCIETGLFMLSLQQSELLPKLQRTARLLIEIKQKN